MVLTATQRNATRVPLFESDAPPIGQHRVDPTDEQATTDAVWAIAAEISNRRPYVKGVRDARPNRWEIPRIPVAEISLEILPEAY